MRDLVRSEARKAVAGRTWLIMLGVGVLLGLMTTAGYTTTVEQEVAAGLAPAAATASMVRFWFGMMLASMLFGAVFVTREYGTGAIARSVLVSGGRGRLFTAKVLVGSIAGVGYGVLAAGLAVGSAWLFLPLAGQQLTWSTEATLTLVGVTAVVALAGPWGVVFGWLLRNQVLAVATLLVLTLLVDEALLRLVPAVGRFTMQIAMGAVYRDAKPEMLSPTMGLLVILGWIALVGAVALRRLRRSDVLS
ncbi:ABC transporter permease [Nakamurella sp.]|uniref:ABC transporter permease n=1 Tax=Nakamurella sp. TaxID=1869182 RepID=UPI003B3A0B7E